MTKDHILCIVMVLRKRALPNILGKVTNAGKQNFLLLPQCFLPYLNSFQNKKFDTLPNWKEFADDNFKSDENGRKFFKWV